MRPDRPMSRVLHGYGPVGALAVLFTAMAVLAPTVRPTVVTQTAGDDGSSAAQATEGTPGSAGSVSGGGSTAGTFATDSAMAGRAGAGGQPTATACPDRKQQVPGDPYSPPCFTFSGDNGGNTSPGVTADTVVVSSRVLSDVATLEGTLAQMSGGKIAVTFDDLKRTMAGLVDYFNSRFQFYGRKIKLVFYDGRGAGTTELLGGGQEEAEADAIKVAEEIHGFADVGGFTAPYADALARRKVVSFGAPSVEANWMTSRRPYAWSVFGDCTHGVDILMDWAIKRVLNRPAVWAGGDLKGKPRIMSAIAPDNPWYQPCLQNGLKQARVAGADIQLLPYRFEFTAYSNQAASLIAKLKSRHVTTVLCGCDPLFTIFLSSKAKEQNYQPEWVNSGAAFTDLDLAGQLNDQDQWGHAFGISQAGSSEPFRASIAYHAYKAVRSDEPEELVLHLAYQQLYLLAIGIQMAGPHLTPETFEKGMFAYPGGSGSLGTWRFGPGRYTPAIDAREVWWDPKRPSLENGQAGAWVESEPGKRYRAGQWPAGDPPLFR